jgi:hypothetical protein
MRMAHLRSRGKSLLKRAKKPNPNFARSNSAHLVTLTMILLHARNNAHGKLVVPANLAKIGLVPMIDDQDAVLTQIFPGKVMTPMDVPGMERAQTAMLTNIPLNHPGSDLAERGTFMNVLIHTTNVMKGIINNIVCPEVHARKPRHA